MCFDCLDLVRIEAIRISIYGEAVFPVASVVPRTWLPCSPTT